MSDAGGASTLRRFHHVYFWKTVFVYTIKNITLYFCFPKLGVDLEKRTTLGKTALMLAVQHGKCVELMLQWGADVNAMTSEGETALLEAIECRERDKDGSMEIMRNIIACGADFEGNDQFYRTPLDLAAFMNDGEVTELLCKAGANPNVGGVRNRFPLVTAALYGSASSLEVGWT